MCAIGYAVIAVALVLFVQATNVYPQLLLGRLLFSVGGSAVSTMVTAVLPTVTGRALREQAYRASVSSELTITPARLNGRQNGYHADSGTSRASPSARLSGFVGLFAGCGALVSLGVFLPLPARFEKLGLSPAEAIRRSYYLVAAVAIIISLISFIGLRDLPDEEGKGLRALWNSQHAGDVDENDEAFDGPERLPYWKQLTTALLLGVRNRSIGLGYVGGFVARASSVGISLFIPLAVNHYYRVSGLCDEAHEPMPNSGLGEIRKACPRAYILASILTGVSQLIALIAAPAFGYLTDKSRRYNVPLLVAALVGVVGYLAFGLLPNPQFKGPDGNAGVFIVMALLGISQIGAIVCSLAVLSNGILQVGADDDALRKICAEQRIDHERTNGGEGENQPLLAHSVNHRLQHLSHLKGSIAGVYSLYGGAGILILTKIGGLLFDVLSSGTPFFIMASFNGILLVTGIVCGILNHVARSKGVSG